MFKKLVAAVVLGLGAVVALQSIASPDTAQPYRSRSVVYKFKKANPCPVTGVSKGACFGWQVDHVKALECGGSDTVDNLQWLTVEQHKVKTREDNRMCRRSRKN